jgi:surface protein
MSNVENMNYTFFKCILLNSFPDLSKWDVSNVKYLNYIFGNCKSLTNLPDISHWNVKNVIEMNNIFINIRNEIDIIYNINQSDIRVFGESFVKNNIDNCLLLFNNKIIKLCEFIKNEDITLNLDKNENNSFHLFEDSCMDSTPETQNQITLKLIEINKMSNLSYMFDSCDSFDSIPDFTYFNTININNISFMFHNCKSLLSIPDISKLNVENVISMSSLFSNCQSLRVIPDISCWKINNNQNLSYMFYNCQSLSSLPDISKWNIENVNDMSFMFYNCKLKIYAQCLLIAKHYPICQTYQSGTLKV